MDGAMSLERKSRSNQNKDGDRIIIPAGQRALAMKNIALRCKHVCGIFDLPKFSKCVSSKSKNKQTQKIPQAGIQTFCELEIF